MLNPKKLAGIISNINNSVLVSSPITLTFEMQTPEQINIRAIINRTLAVGTTCLAEVKITGSSIWKSVGYLSFVLASNVPTGAVFVGKNNFAGVAFDLTPGTSYDVRLTGTEPGVGTWQVTGTQGTRALPAIAPLPNKTATPSNIAAQLLTLVAGDCLQLTDGTYPAITIARSGTIGAPIYIRGASRTGVIISSSTRCIVLSDASHIVLENMTLQGSRVDSGTNAFSNGVLYLTGYNQTNTTIRQMTFEGTDYGCKAYTEVYGRLVYNCTFNGNNTWDKTYIINPASGAPNYTWNDDGVGGPGSGNCVFNCTFTGYGDTIKQGGSSTISGVTYCGANHNYRNRIKRTGDDAFEFDRGAGNCSAYDNIIDNAGQFASLDEIFGGPIYLHRNSIGNTARGPIKPSSTSQNVKIWSNTFVRTTGAVPYNFYAPWSYKNDSWSFRNNLIIYRGNGEVVRLDATLGELDWDYNALYPSTGSSITLGGRYGGPSLALAKIRLAPLMMHDVASVSNPFVSIITMPTDYTTEYIGSMDFTLASDASVRNVGVTIPGVTDGFTGSAPDIGAVISGRGVPIVGDNTLNLVSVQNAPAWVATLPTNTWTLVSSQSFSTWVAGGGIPNAGYRGSDWSGAIISAYSSPALDDAGAAAYLHGGGHGDGSYNGVIKCDLKDFTYSVAVRPTPPSAYPPSYMSNIPAPRGLSGLIYPSGANDGAVFFIEPTGHVTFLDNLTDPADIPYNAPERAPAASHTYGNLTFWNGPDGVSRISTHYMAGAIANLTTGRWVECATDRYSKQLGALGLYNFPFQQGTKSHYDATTKRTFCTLTPGDMGINKRNHIIQIEPMSQTIEATYYVPAYIYNQSAICVVGRKLWLFNAGKNVQLPVTFDMDTHVFTHYSVTGDIIPDVSGYNQDVVPCCVGSDTNTIYRWNHGADTNSMHTLNLTPTSGSGTVASPYVLTQTRRALSGNMPALPVFQYKLLKVTAWGVILCLHGPKTGWYALKLS